MSRPFWRTVLLPSFLVLLAVNLGVLLAWTLPREDGREAVARHAEQTLRFHREQLGGRGFDEVSLRSAALDPAEASEALGAALGVVPRLVRPWAALGDAEDGEAAQAVAGAAACVLRRVA